MHRLLLYLFDIKGGRGGGEVEKVAEGDEAVERVNYNPSADSGWRRGGGPYPPPPPIHIDLGTILYKPEPKPKQPPPPPSNLSMGWEDALQCVEGVA